MEMRHVTYQVEMNLMEMRHVTYQVDVPLCCHRSQEILMMSFCLIVTTKLIAGDQSLLIFGTLVVLGTNHNAHSCWRQGENSCVPMSVY